jgi:hypothetical protein
MHCLRQVMVVGAVLMAAAAGCGDNGAGELGQIEMRVTTAPSDVTSIHVTVTAPDFSADVSANLVESGGFWFGTLTNVPPGVGRTVTAYGYNEAGHLIYQGVTENVTVFSGKLISVTIILLPYPNDPGGNINTPPHFVELVHPDGMGINDTTELMATALDPDNNALLTYTWSSTPSGLFDDGDVDGGGIGNVVVNRFSGDPVTVQYTAPENYNGIAIIQVSVSDGEATATTTFPIAVGSGITPGIKFDVLPDLSITGVERQVLMPDGSTGIGYTLSNPGTDWSADPMHLRTTWSDNCGGRFDSSDSDLVDLYRNQSVDRVVTYTASGHVPSGVDSCDLRLSVVDEFGASIWSGIVVWIEEPLAVFVTSGTVDGASFAGQSTLADAFCQYYATHSGVPQGPYKAFLSFDAISARDRIVDGPYVLPYGRGPVARSKAELFSQDLLNSIQFDENNQPVSAEPVFTGTDADGLPSQRCNNWTSNNNVDFGTAGLTEATGSSWNAAGTLTCEQPAHVYCFQQAHERE